MHSGAKFWYCFTQIYLQFAFVICCWFTLVYMKLNANSLESRDLIISKTIFQAVSMGKTYLLVIKSSQKWRSKKLCCQKKF